MTGNDTNTKGNQMHAERINASRKYEAAVKAFRSAGMGSDLAKWQAADAALTIARDELVAAEMRYPTSREIARERNEVRRANMGFRVNK